MAANLQRLVPLTKNFLLLPEKTFFVSSAIQPINRFNLSNPTDNIQRLSLGPIIYLFFGVKKKVPENREGALKQLCKGLAHYLALGFKL